MFEVEVCLAGIDPSFVRVEARVLRDMPQTLQQQRDLIRIGAAISAPRAVVRDALKAACGQDLRV
jgi:hypothetical protein